MRASGAVWIVWLLGLWACGEMPDDKERPRSDAFEITDGEGEGVLPQGGEGEPAEGEGEGAGTEGEGELGGEGEGESVVDDHMPLAGPLSVERPLLLLLYQPADGTPLAHPLEHYQRVLFGPDKPNVRDYFADVSGDAFSVREAGAYVVTDREGSDVDAGILPTDGFTDIWRKRALFLAEEAGFDFSLYDANSDGVVTGDELWVLSLDRFSETLGQAGFPSCVARSGVQVCLGVALVAHRSPFWNFTHELAHLLNPMAFDLYGENCNSFGLTLMSCTAGDQLAEQALRTYLDPWHRARYGWTEELRSSAPEGAVLLKAPRASGEGVERVVWQVPNESIAVSFELREGIGYDDVALPGVFAWYEQTDAGGWPALIAGFNGGVDASIFTLAPVQGCRLDASAPLSRGQVAAVSDTPGRVFAVVDVNGRDLGVRFRVTPWSQGDSPRYALEWSTSFPLDCL